MQARHQRARVLGGIAVALVLAGCGSGSAAAPSTSAAPPASPSTSASAPTATKSPAAPVTTKAAPVSGTTKQADGRTLVTDTDAGFQLALPRGYTRITSRAQLDKILSAGSKALKGRVPNVAANAFAKNVKVFALDQLTGGTVSLASLPANGATSDDLPAQGDAIKAVLTGQLKATSVSTSKITVDGQPALRADGTIAVNGVKARLTQIYAVGGDNLYIVTIGGPATPESVVTGVASSLHFLS